MTILLQSSEFSALSDGQLLFLAVIIFALLYAGLQLRSIATIGVTALSVMTLMGVFEGLITLGEFWIMLIACFMVLSISMAVSVNR